ncbi:hypothetical protein SAMN05216268_114176 [Streptomyces yunnanensis]|uniref:Uncharacterized protein n=1 Tax=Streptomyces yunnanensis TaxID=156453 RepID=A0A9X8N327_9ACTN|nr:hypothetical protein SAMN05216268_114176 [Streptomyces yunnanensis]
MAFRAVHAKWDTVFSHLPDVGCGRAWEAARKVRPAAPMSNGPSEKTRGRRGRQSMPRSGPLPFGNFYDLDVRQLRLSALGPAHAPPRRCAVRSGRFRSGALTSEATARAGVVVLHFAQDSRRQAADSDPSERFVPFV